VYGVRKAWRVLRWEGRAVGRDRVGRLMRALGLADATRTKRVRTTKPAAVSQRPADLVERVFSAPAPNRLWVADLERHEALTNRAVMERAPPPAHRSWPVKLGATRTQGRG
jgi:transposase InsO family protein